MEWVEEQIEKRKNDWLAGRVLSSAAEEYAIKSSFSLGYARAMQDVLQLTAGELGATNE